MFLPGWPSFSLSIYPSSGISFRLIKKGSEIQEIEIFDHCYLYTAYVIDTTFFLKKENSIKPIVKTGFS